MSLSSDPRREHLQHVHWIGGGSGAGKTTVARRLADEYSMKLYDTDEVMGDHARRCAPADAPFLSQFVAMDMDERWVNRSPAAMLDTLRWFRGEGFDLIVEDLLRLPREQRVLAAGLRLLPRLVAPLLLRPERAVWLIPTPDFRSAAFEERGFTWVILGRTTNPAGALENLLERDRLFTERLSAEAASLDLRLIPVDGSADVDTLTRRVAESLCL